MIHKKTSSGEAPLSPFRFSRRKGSKMDIINVMEEVVEQRLKLLTKDADYCTCDECMDDMMCLALNALPAKYVSTPKGNLFTRLSETMISQHMIDVNIACVNAIEFVKERPRHEAKS